MSSSALNLTFGVELEFTVCTLPSSSVDPDPHDPRSPFGITKAENSSVRPEESHKVFDLDLSDWDEHNLDLMESTQAHIANTLRSNGIAARSQLAENLKGMEEQANQSADLSWWITEDCTVKGPTGDYSKDYTYIPIEIQSPPLRFVPSSVTHVEKVASHLCTTYRIITNETCGYHCQ